jgi:CRISPR/Cas system CMR-associated protein Cmr5 small subunit
MRIRAAGLGQALAFVRAKAQPSDPKKRKEGLVRLLKALGDWAMPRLDSSVKVDGDPALATDDALIRAILDRDSLFLRRATLETLAYLEWLNRFAEAEGLGDAAANSD